MSEPLVIPGNPVAQGRVRSRIMRSGSVCPTCHQKRDAFVRHHQPSKSRKYKELVRRVARTAGVTPLSGPVSVHIVAAWEWPTADRRVTKPREPEYLDKCEDTDNIAKAILDALNGIAYADDRQVAQLAVEKARAAQGAEAATYVWIRPLKRTVPHHLKGLLACPAS